jgi:hypothetical protein
MLTPTPKTRRYFQISFWLLAFCFYHCQLSGQNAVPTEPPQVADRKAGAASSIPELPHLIDITEQAGIHFRHAFTQDKRYIVDSMSGGVALIDYDRDGWPDIFFTNAPDVETPEAQKNAPSALYRNNHDGTFTDVTEKAGVGHPCWAMGAVVGDYNNDGWPDLLVTCFGGVVLYRNNGDGTFTDVTAQSGLDKDRGWATGATFGDFDNDGYVDLFVPHYVDLDLNHLPVLGSRNTCVYHEVPVQCGPRGLSGAPDNLYRNDGRGHFIDVSVQQGVDDPHRLFGLAAVWSDFNRDGKLDLFVANDGEPNFLYRNDGRHFSDIAFDDGIAVSGEGSEQANMGVALGDYDHTGRFSIAITHFSDEYTGLFREEKDFTFTDVSHPAGIAQATAPLVGWGAAFFDFDNDGWEDLIQVNGHVYPQVDLKEIGTRFRQPKLLFLNHRDGTFREIGRLVGDALEIAQVSRGLAIGDLFNEGRISIVVENLDGAPMILRPQGGVRNHWVSFELSGTKSNRLALNARVRVTTGDLVQVDEVRSGGSYLSQSDLRLHFGLGNHNTIDKVEVIWPSGRVDVLSNLGVDQFYSVLEGRGIVPASDIFPKASVPPGPK